MDQKEIIRQLKIAKIENDWFKYEDIAEMLQIRIGSLYNFLNGQYKLSQTKAKILQDWLINTN